MAEKRAIKNTRDYKTPKKEQVDKMLESSDSLNYSSFAPIKDDTPEESATAYMQHVEITFSRLFTELAKMKNYLEILHE